MQILQYRYKKERREAALFYMVVVLVKPFLTPLNRREATPFERYNLGCFIAVVTYNGCYVIAVVT